MLERPILTTGGAGFISSHLTDALPAHGYRMRVSDNLSTDKHDSLPLDDERVELLKGDTADAAILAAALKGCAVVTHLAAVASVQASMDDPVATYQNNFITTPNLCEAMREQGAECVVFTFSTAAYGWNGEGMATDKDIPKLPLTPYASDKLASEYYPDFYCHQYGLEPAILRSPNVYGPCQDPSSPRSGVIGVFTERALKGTPITVLGDGEQTRDFIYVADLVGFLIQVLEAAIVKPGVMNVGLNRSISPKQLLAEIDQVLGGLPLVTHADARAGDIRRSRASNERLPWRSHLDQPTPMSVGLAHLFGC